jgi:hypothetical protein
MKPSETQLRLAPDLLAKANALAVKASAKAGVAVTRRQIIEAALRTAWGLSAPKEPS